MQTENPRARDIAQQELRDVLASTEALLAALGDQSGEGAARPPDDHDFGRQKAAR